MAKINTPTVPDSTPADPLVEVEVKVEKQPLNTVVVRLTDDELRKLRYAAIERGVRRETHLAKQLIVDGLNATK